MNTFKRDTERSTTVSAKQNAADLDWAIGLNRKLLKMLGLWSYVGETRWQTAQSNSLTFLFVMSAFCFVTLPQTMALIKVWGNLLLIVENLLTNVAATMSQVKVIITWLNKRALAELLDEITSDWFRKKKVQERQVMLKYANITRIVTIMGLMCTAFCVVFCIAPIAFGIVTRTITNLTDKPGRHFPLQAVYLYDTSSISSYYLTILSQFVGCFFGGLCYSGIDVIFGMLVLHICGQFENLSNSIHTMVNDVKRGCFQDILNTQIQTHYRLIRYAMRFLWMYTGNVNHFLQFITTFVVKLLIYNENSMTMILTVQCASFIYYTANYTARCGLPIFSSNVEIIESMFSWIMLGLTGSFAVMFSTVGFQIVQESATSDGTVPQIIFHMNLLLASGFFMFLYSWVGEYLVTQSDSIHTAICSCNWTNLTPEEASQLIIILVRTQYSLRLTAGKLLPLTMNTYVSLLKSCGGYISCLLAVRK